MRKILVRLRLMWVEKRRMALKEVRMYHSHPRRRGKAPNTSFRIIPTCWNKIRVCHRLRHYLGDYSGS